MVCKGALGEALVSALAIEPESRMIWTGTMAGRLTAHAMAPGLVARGMITPHRGGSIRCLHLHTPTSLLYSGGFDGTVCVTDVKDPTAPLLLRRLQGPHAASACVSLAYCPGPKLLLSADSRGRLAAWSVEGGACSQVITIPAASMEDFRFYSEGGVLLTASGGEIRLWNATFHDPPPHEALSEAAVAVAAPGEVGFTIATPPDSPVSEAAAEDPPQQPAATSWRDKLSQGVSAGSTALSGTGSALAGAVITVRSRVQGNGEDEDAPGMASKAEIVKQAAAQAKAKAAVFFSGFGRSAAPTEQDTTGTSAAHQKGVDDL